MSFELVQGVGAENIDGVHSAYSVLENQITAVLGAELFEPVISAVINKLPEPVFFFLELPCSDDEEKKLRKSKSDPFHYNVYYLDGCTIPVARAIMKRYGELLINDGMSRFGFGSHESGAEIYCLNYQNIAIFGNVKDYEPIFKKLKIPFEKEHKTLWDNFTNETPGSIAVVEINGETVYDIPELLKGEGMYLAQTLEEN